MAKTKPLFLEFAEVLYAENCVMKRMLYEQSSDYRVELDRRLANPQVQAIVRTEFDRLYGAIRHDRDLRNAIQDFQRHDPKGPKN